MELKQLITKYANDVIATSAFGLKVDSFKYPDNVFYAMGKRVSNFAGVRAIVRMTLFMIMPRILKVNNFINLENN